jgi:NADP-dependent 3-hydroxy acid dehydrogenase YdfG
VEIMKTRGHGDIINVSSISGRRSAVRFAAYSPSKFAVNSMTESLRQEVGGLGIRVCVVEPGATESEVAEGISDPALRASLRQHVTRHGAMKATDVADAIVFVASLPSRANISELLIRPTIDVAAL